VSALPAAYFAAAHVALAAAAGVLVVDPALPAGVFYQPKVIALVHLVTVGWLTASILGAFYIAGPLALGVPMPVRALDWIAFASFAIGAAGMVSHFWIATYGGMAWSALMVVVAVGLVAFRAARGMRQSAVAGALRLHLVLALANFLAAAVLGMLIGFDRSSGTFGLSPLSSAWAHAHLAAIGWVMLMVIGMAYRLIPMMLPAAIPTGRRLYLSAVLIEIGLAILFTALLTGSPWLLAGSVLIVAGLANFVVVVRGIVRARRPRPPALPRRDWSVWQTQAAIASMVVAAGCGLALSTGRIGDWRLAVAWVYGVVGLVGFLAQMVAGVEARLVPWYAWYRAQAALGGATPVAAANALPSAAYARLVLLGWITAVPLLAIGLATNTPWLVRPGAFALFTGVVTGALHLRHMLRGARAI
jgi:hypothetical protein